MPKHRLLILERIFHVDRSLVRLARKAHNYQNQQKFLDVLWQLPKNLDVTSVIGQTITLNQLSLYLLNWKMTSRNNGAGLLCSSSSSTISCELERVKSLKKFYDFIKILANLLFLPWVCNGLSGHNGVSTLALCGKVVMMAVERLRVDQRLCLLEE